MGLDSMGTEIYAIHGYFHGLMVGQRTPEFLGCHRSPLKIPFFFFSTMFSPYISIIKTFPRVLRVPYFTF